MTPIKQIKLTRGRRSRTSSPRSPISPRSPASCRRRATTPTPALQTELDGIAKKHGFASFSELDDVAANISIVMAGLDAQTGEFTDPVDALKKELADVTADASIPERTRKQLIKELTEAIKTTPRARAQGERRPRQGAPAEIEKALQ